MFNAGNPTRLLGDIPAFMTENVMGYLSQNAMEILIRGNVYYKTEPLGNQGRGVR
ncbi:hypothetical protein DPMN_126292 [Dreissena polymorpha]|uniref:Uncharacterized protein n=1 Tax=Dreissena polymorpha TaxID=45954 RepID=A0A9D4GZS2_DREPO|nr:hypothetical protein DPMN_126292 [Dreissena polymorpha]